jgi:hypothetical protein
MLRLSKTGLVLPFLCLLFLTPAVQAQQSFTARGVIPSLQVSGHHYTFGTPGTSDLLGDIHGRGGFDLNRNTGGRLSDGQLAFVDANGDYLFLTFVGVTHDNTVKLNFSIAGGTGQWDGATGSGIIVAHLMADGSADWRCEGVMD